jgi:cadmium resistance protein CadD (predicted permease)
VGRSAKVEKWAEIESRAQLGLSFVLFISFLFIFLFIFKPRVLNSNPVSSFFLNLYCEIIDTNFGVFLGIYVIYISMSFSLFLSLLSFFLFSNPNFD